MSTRILLLVLTLAAPVVLRAAAGAADSAAAAPVPAAATAAIPAAAADLPQPLPADRYARLIEKSPFAPATPVATEDTAGFAQNLYITGIGKIGNQDCVFIASRADEKSRFMLVNGEEGEQGMKIERLTYSSDIGRTTVTVRKGGDVAILKFDQAVIQKTVAPVIPQQPNIPRPGGRNFGPAQQQAQPGAGAPTESRRRIRIINNRQ